jgi:hypothetical protein
MRAINKKIICITGIRKKVYIRSYKQLKSNAMKLDTMTERLAKTIPEIDLAVAKKVINVFRQWESDIRGKYCEVCGKSITHQENRKTTMNDFTYCCDEHGDYRSAYNMDVVRRDLGITINPNDIYDL